MTVLVPQIASREVCKWQQDKFTLREVCNGTTTRRLQLSGLFQRPPSIQGNVLKNPAQALKKLAAFNRLALVNLHIVMLYMNGFMSAKLYINL